MATTQPVLDADEKYETLSHLYLLLWKQLDLFTGDDKWLDIRPSTAGELRNEAQQALEALFPLIKDGEFLRVVQADFDRVQLVTAHAKDTPKPEVESLKSYLRDQALRYAEEAGRS
jgi:hypothetical protein